MGLSSDPATLDPRFVAEDVGDLIVDALFDPLVRTDPDGRVVPSAAARWEVADGATEFTFHLREATFHDGSSVTAADFVRSFRRIADGTARPRSFLGYLLAPVVGATQAREQGVPLSGVAALDERTLNIRLAEPDPGFLVTLSHPSLVPLPAVADQDPEAFAEQPVGNGPFAMAGPREAGMFVRLSRFDEHPEPALLDEVVLSVYSDPRGPDRQWTDLLDGQLHVADLDPHHRAEAIERFGTSTDGYAGPGVLDGVTSGVYLYGFDTTLSPFDDARVRRALSLSIDREAIATEVMLDTRAAATSIVPPPLPGANAGACEACRHDPEEAAELLAEVRAETQTADDRDADQADPDQADPDEADPDVAPETVIDRVTLTHTRGDTHAAIADRMAKDITTALDIEVDFQARDLQTFIESVREGDVPLFRLGWEVNVPDPDAYLRPLFHSSQVGLDNLTRYDVPEVDQLLDEARGTIGSRQRLAAYREAEERILRDMPVLPVLWYRHSTVVRTEVQDLVYSPLGRVNFARVWIDPAAG